VHSAAVLHRWPPPPVGLPIPRLRGGSGKLQSDSSGEEGPALHTSALSACCRRATEQAERRARKAERCAKELQKRIEHLEEEFCKAEAELVQARAEASEAASLSERKVRAELEGRLAALNQRCNEAEAEVQWGNGERTRDLMVISELQHKVDGYERERAELEDKIRREMAEDRGGASGEGIRLAPGHKAVPPVPLELESQEEEEGTECGEKCWCGASGKDGGDLAGDGGWTGLEGASEEEGPEVLKHADGCGSTGASSGVGGSVATAARAAGDGRSKEEDMTPVQLLDLMRNDARYVPGKRPSGARARPL
jgi:hypothetical protein